MINRQPSDLPWIDPIPPGFEHLALAAWEKGDWPGFLLSVSNEKRLDLLAQNIRAFQSRGWYEAALLNCYIGTRTNHVAWPLEDLRDLFRLADPERLRAAG